MLNRFLLLAIAVLTLSAARSAVFFHARIVKAAPAVDGWVTAPPAALLLWFSEPVYPRLTSAAILTVDSVPVSRIQFIATPDSLNVVGPVGALLTPGAYRVQWRSMAVDGHVIRGEYQFHYAP
jgi:methionine-rich copper-binding protein CopC